MTEERLNEIEAATYVSFPMKAELIAEVRRLREENQSLERAVQLGEGHHLTLLRETALQNENERLRQENQQLRQDLRDYGHHDASCPQGAIAFHGSLSAGALLDRGCEAECTCGLEAALGGPEAE